MGVDISTSKANMRLYRQWEKSLADREFLKRIRLLRKAMTEHRIMHFFQQGSFFMESRGVCTELDCSEIQSVQEKDPAMLVPDQVIDKLKYMAVEHNIYRFPEYQDRFMQPTKEDVKSRSS